MDRKLFNSTPLTTKSHFREWSEEFVDFVAMRDAEMSDGLNASKESKVAITSLGDNPSQVSRAKQLYRVLRKLVEHPHGRTLVVHAPDKHVWEAWRNLHQRFDPQNDAANTSTVLRLVDAS